MVKKDEKLKNEIAKVEPPLSERFTNMVMKEFSANIGILKLSPKQKKLSQHMYLKCDAQLKSFEAKRLSKNNDSMAPYIWDNINMDKLTVDAVNRIDLGLDALIENHISPIAYFNKKEKKYDLDLRIGYAGKDYYRRKTAINLPKDIIYELVYGTDNFKPIKKSAKVKIESYEFEIVEPFNRGDVIGGFGYIIFEDEKLNKLVVVSEKEFLKSKSKAKTQDFWSKYPEEMRLKTLVHRTTDKLQVDPDKVNQSYFKVEADEMSELKSIDDEINQNANIEEIDIEEAEVIEEQDTTPEGEIIPPDTGINTDEPIEPGF